MKRNLLKFVVAIAICFAVHVSICLISSLIVNHLILNTRLANFSIYDGYADLSILLAYIPLSALLVFNKIKGNALVITTASFAGLLVAKVFIVDLIAHYLRFYVKTQQNGSYNFEIFKQQIGRQWDSLLWEFSNLGQFLSTIIWVFIALLGICYFSLWAKNKLKQELKVSPIFGLFLLLGFSSCGDHIQREKDRYPNIPDFPKFGDNKLVLKELEVATVKYKKHQSAEVHGHDLVIHTQDYFYYLATDQSLFVLTGYREAVEPGNEFPAKNSLQLIRLKAGKVEKLNWSEVAKAELRPLNDEQYISTGSKTFDIQSPRLTFSNVKPLEKDSTHFSSWNFASRSGGDYDKIFDSTFVKEFDRVTIGSAGRLSGGLNNGINYVYDPVPLVYYQFNVGNKIGLTKINFDEQKPPLLIKVANQVYCITYTTDLKLKYEVKHYHIGILE